MTTEAPAQAVAPSPPVAGGGVAPPTAPSAPAAAAPPTAQPPQGPLAAFWNAEKAALDTEKLAAAYTERDNVFALHNERMKGVPEKAEAYKAEPILPEGVKMPEGAKLEFDPKAIAQAGALAHSAGIPQQTFSQLLGLYAAHQIKVAEASVAEHKTMLAAENAKLGEGGPVRRQAIEAYATAQNLPADETAEMRLLLSTEAGVRFLERMIGKANGSGVPGHPQNQPNSPPPQTIEQRWYGAAPERKAS